MELNSSTYNQQLLSMAIRVSKIYKCLTSYEKQSIFFSLENLLRPSANSSKYLFHIVIILNIGRL